MVLLMLCRRLHPCLNILNPRLGVVTRWPWCRFRTGWCLLIGKSRDSRIVFLSFPFPFVGVVVRLRLLYCARVATTVGPASNTSSEGTNSHAHDALRYSNESIEVYAEQNDELLLELELELELELLSAAVTTTSVGVWAVGMGKRVSLLIAGCSRRPDPKHFTIATHSSSPTMKYGCAMMGCAFACGYAGHTCTTTWCRTSLDTMSAHLCRGSIRRPSLLYSHAALCVPHGSCCGPCHYVLTSYGTTHCMTRKKGRS